MKRIFSLSYCSLIIFVSSLLGANTFPVLSVKLAVALAVPVVVAWLEMKLEE